MNYVVVIERNEDGYGASIPDLPGCVATGETLDELKALAKAAITAHVAQLRRLGQTVPEPTTLSWHVVEEEGP
jgi:predicted RNase H-like HicB family nuclease